MKVKKSLFVVSALIFGAVTLTACEQTPVSSTTPGQDTANWAGLTQLEFVMGDVPADYDYLSGVSATAKDGTALTVDLDQDSKDILTEIAAAEDEHLYVLTYEAKDAEGNVVSTADRRVQIIFGYKLDNGDFSSGTLRWATGFNSGAGTVAAENGELHYSVTNTGSEAWVIQTEYDGLKFKQGETYKFSVQARAKEGSEGKSLALGFEDMNNGYAMLVPAYVEHSLTTEMTTYTIYYTADKDYDNVKAALYLGRGLDKDDSASEDTPLEFYVDNASIEKIEKADIEFTNVTLTASDRQEIDSLDDIAALREKVTATLNGTDITDDIKWEGEMPTGFVDGLLSTNIGQLGTYTTEDGKIGFAYIGFTWKNPASQKENAYAPSNDKFDQGLTFWTQDKNGDWGGEADFIDNGDGTITIDVDATNGSGTDWHLQLWQSSSNLQKDHKYRIKVTGKVETETPDDVKVISEFNGDKHKTELALTSEMSTVYSDVLTMDADQNGVRTGLLLGSGHSQYKLTLDEFTVIDVTDEDPVQATPAE